MLRFYRLTLILALLSITLACGLFNALVPTPEPLWTYSNPNFSTSYASIELLDDTLFTYQSGVFNEQPVALIAIDPSNGQELWTPFSNDELVGFDGIIGNHAIFSGRASDEVNEDGEPLFPVIALNLATGLEDWRYIGITYNSSISWSEKYIFAPKSFSQTDVIDVQTGEVISTFKKEYVTEEIFDLNPGWIKYIYTDDMIYSLSPAGVLRQYDTKATTLQKTTTLDVPRHIQSAFIEAGILYVYSSPELDGDLHLLAYNLETGTRLWDVNGLRGSAFGVEFYNGVGYLDTLNGPSALDLTTGQILWSVPSQLAAFFIGDASNGILLAAKDNLLTAYESSNGQKLWSYKISLPISLNVKAINGIAYVVSADDPPAFQSTVIPRQLDAIDIKTGKQLWRYENVYVTLPMDIGSHIIVGHEGGIIALPR